MVTMPSASSIVGMLLLTAYYVGASAFLFVEFGAWGSADYARYLMHKYGEMSKGEKRKDIFARAYVPYWLSYEQKYKCSYRRKRFYYFLWQSRMLYLLFYVYIIICVGAILLTIANYPLSIQFDDLLFNCCFLMVVIPNVLAELTLIPFGFIKHLVINGRWGSGGTGWIG